MSAGEFTAISILILIGSSVIGTIITVVYILTHKDQPIKFDLSLLLKIYVYLVMMITLIAGTLGLAQLGKAAFSYIVGYDFSYSVWEITEPIMYDDYEGRPYETPAEQRINIEGEEYQTDFTQRRNDLLVGSSFFITSVLIFGLHRFLLGFFGKDKEDETQILLLRKIYMLINLAIFSVSSILLIPGSIYSVIDYLTYNSTSTDYYSRPVAGETLALALVVVPVWIWFLLQTMRLYRKNK